MKTFCFLQLIRLFFLIKKHIKYSQYKLYEVKTIEKPTRKEINQITWWKVRKFNQMEEASSKSIQVF